MGEVWLAEQTRPVRRQVALKDHQGGHGHGASRRTLRVLKPSNVLVTLHNDRAVPKIIDFGVAKATPQHLTERTLFTALGVLVGTPEYMSPEQAELTGLDIDTHVQPLGGLAQVPRRRKRAGWRVG